jgi:uncharacterized membrane protein
MVFGLICLIGSAFAVFAALMFGAWLVMPFAGVELVCVAVAFFWWDRHAQDFEAIIVEGQSLQVVRQYGARVERCDLPAAWAHVSRETKPSGWGRRHRLVIVSRGQMVTFGEYLNETAVNEVQRVLRNRLSPAWL